MKKLLEASCACKVTFGYSPRGANEDAEVIFFVDANYLWSAEGLASLFEETRRGYLVKPDENGKFEEPEYEDVWDSWHLVGVCEEGDGFVLSPKIEPDISKGPAA